MSVTGALRPGRGLQGILIGGLLIESFKPAGLVTADLSSLGQLQWLERSHQWRDWTVLLGGGTAANWCEVWTKGNQVLHLWPKEGVVVGSETTMGVSKHS